ncbi:MAG: hypothetical protein IJ525_05005 [Alphaproteobacteria bacterium]|nr:hypothetical protein [Alphaproteobacteria bacterium]
MKNFDTKNIKSGRSLLPICEVDAPLFLSTVYTDSTPAKNRQSDAPQYGRSMIEMLGVLAIIGVLSVGGIAGYSKAMTKYRINKTIEQITLIAGNIHTFFGQQQNYQEIYCGGSCNGDGCQAYSGIGNNGNFTYSFNGCPIIKKAKIFSDEMLTVTDGKIMSITNAFGGNVYIYSISKAIGGDQHAFAISYNIGDNMEACIELLTQDWMATNAKALRLDTAGSTVEDIHLKLPLTIDDAAEKCATAMQISKSHGKDDVSLELFFDIDLNGKYWNPRPFEIFNWQN